MISWFKRHLVTILILAGLVVGIGLILYPSVANYWNTFHQTRAIMTYTDAVSSMNEADYDEILSRAWEYNTHLGQTGIQWNMTDEQKKEYENMLRIDGSDVMGYLNIPKRLSSKSC